MIDAVLKSSGWKWVDTGRRRRCSQDEKLKIVLESLRAPRQVAATAAIRCFVLVAAAIATILPSGA